MQGPTHDPLDEPVDQHGCGPPGPGGPPRPDRAAFAAADAELRRRILARQTARFAAAFTRWVDAYACDGLSYGRLQVLEALGDGPTIMRDLSDRLGISPRNTTAVIDALESAGLVERHPHPTDRRATLVGLTARGAAAAAARLGPAQAALDRLFEGFSAEEEEQFLTGLLRLVDALHNHSQGHPAH